MASNRLTAAQVAFYVKAAGPPAGTTVAEWVAKADEESDYYADADNGIAAGLWQINYRVHKQLPNADLFKPGTNFQAAKRTHNAAGGWSPWNASGGKPRVKEEHNAAASNIALPPSSGSGGGLDDVGAAASDFAKDPAGFVSGAVGSAADLG